MSHQSKCIRPSLIGVMILGLLVGVFLVVRGRSSKPDPKVTRRSVETSPDEVLQYWEKKKKDVKPKPLPEVPADALEKPDKQTSSRKPDAKHS
jgi:hypothetical protein